MANIKDDAKIAVAGRRAYSGKKSREGRQGSRREDSGKERDAWQTVKTGGRMDADK